MTSTEKANAITMVATTAVFANRFIKMAAAGANVGPCTVQGEDVIGVASSSVTAQQITDGENAISVVVPDGGKHPCEAGAAIDVSSVAVPITVDSVGRVVAVASDNDRVLGFALESAAGAGEMITCLLLKGAGQGAAAVVASHYVVAAGEFTTAGGDTDETIVDAAILATDIALVTLHTAGASPVTVVDAAAGAGDIDVDMSADPSTDHILSYVVLRAR